MPKDYDKVYEKANFALDNVYSKRGTYPKDTIFPDEDKILEPLRELEASLAGSEELKQAHSTAMIIRDTFYVNYWAEINEECWTALYFEMKRLRNPESINRDEKRKFYKILVSNGLSRWPQQTHKTEKRGNIDDMESKLTCEFIRKEAGLEVD